MSELFQVLSVMAVPALILLGVRHLIVRQNLDAGERSPVASGRGRRQHSPFRATSRCP
jgi:hypothetical protein